MVLQRDIPAPVWGWAEPGETITVRFAGQALTATAGNDGRWQVRLAPLKADTAPQELTVAGKSASVVVHDVLVGDVWVCAGQSNMEFAMGSADNFRSLQPTLANPLIRLLSIKAPQAGTPVADLPNGWTPCDTQTVSGFTAVGYFFGRRIQQEAGIPIGLIGNAWGGTPIELWMPVEAPAGFPELARLRQDYDKRLADFNAELARLIDPMAQWVDQARQAKAAGQALTPPPAVPPHPATGNGGLSGIYNGRVAPLIPSAIKGALWYQGEANGGDDDIYYHKMRALIGGWRQAWAQGDFPFYYVQLANWLQPDNEPAGGSGWARVRMAQLRSLQIPRTGMAVAIDIGEANDIHPKNKEDVGNRLALWALKNDYGRTNVVCSGPLYKSASVEGSRIRVAFDYAEGGLMVGRKAGHGPAEEDRNGRLQRFAVAANSNTWVWADAVIDGSTVLVSSTNVPAPVAVRYGYSMNPNGCNLYNREGLPASPFRSDTW